MSLNASESSIPDVSEPDCESDIGIEESDKLVRFVVHGVLLNAIGAGGLLGNGLSALVLSRPQMRSSVNCLLMGLAACDTVLIVTSVLLFGLTAIYPYTGRLRYYYYHVSPHITPYAYPIANAAQTMSVYLTLIVTVERWVAVCHPFRARALCTSSRARWYVIGTAAFALAYNAPKFFEAELYTRIKDGEIIYCVQPDWEFRTESYVAIYIHWMYLIVMYIIPFSALAALNVRIVTQVRRAQAERARLSRVQRREIGLATMLLVVVLVFFLCNLLPLVTNSFELFLKNQLEKLDPLVKTSNLMVTINSSVNFVIYVIFGEKFQRVFLKMFCAGRIRRRDSPEHTRDDSFASCGERVSLRMTRNGTLRRSEARGAGGGGGAGRPRRAPSPAPTVYYPAPLTDVTSASLQSDAPPPSAARWNGNARVHF
ncbi:FMRFamide receptor [Aphomia sociella]